MEGEVPSPINPKPGCRFCGRCPRATEQCRTQTPAPKDLSGGHLPLVIIWIRRNTTNEYNRNGSNCPGSGPTAGTASGFLRLGSRGEYHRVLAGIDMGAAELTLARQLGYDCVAGTITWCPAG